MPTSLAAEVVLWPLSRARLAPFAYDTALASEYPPARRGDVVDKFHGVWVSDPYRWMEDLASPELEAWIKARNQPSGRS